MRSARRHVPGAPRPGPGTRNDARPRDRTVSASAFPAPASTLPERVGSVFTSCRVKMPDPALETAGQPFAPGGAGGLEQAGDLVAQRTGVGPELFRLGLDGAAQRLKYLTFQPLGSDQGDGQRRQAGGADHDIGGARRTAQRDAAEAGGQRRFGDSAVDLFDGAYRAAAGTDGRGGHGVAPKGVNCGNASRPMKFNPVGEPGRIRLVREM